MGEAANKVERSFSLNKACQEEKIPELLKRKTSLQQTLQVEMGGVNKIREHKQNEWERPQEMVEGKTEEGENFTISAPAKPTDREAQSMEDFRKQSFHELYELERPYEGRPLPKGKGEEEEESKE